ncbi:T9SS type A sorting domain-containing protein [Dysgonomonas sp. OttesenSCG-928-D17]|nr:T9SS type A sorting domain-containing protein [Dysgonomonas sp. OttesenSCG-928-D17]
MRGPLYGTEYILARAAVRHYNFNPAIDLSEIAGNKQFLINKTNLSQMTIISVWGPDYGDFNQDMYLYTLNTRPGQGYIFTKDKVLNAKESDKSIFDYGKESGSDLLYQSTDVEPNITKFRERALRVVSHYRALQPNTSLWGEKEKSTIKISDIYYPALAGNNSTYNIADLNNRAFWGYTPEFIIYNRILTPLERRKAETYLAIKYGFTLDLSYIGSQNQLLWDLDENSGYNSRVTGYGRDDLSGMYQKKALTSHEESPYFSDLAAHDSYDLNISYNLPSRYRHLVIGRQPASPVKDGQYILFGDNDGTIKTASESGVNGIKLMSRHWLLNTNMLPATEQEKTLEWNIQNLEVYTEGFTTKATKAGTSTDQSGSLVTKTPLLDKDGYFSWTISSTRRGPLTIKFGTNNPEASEGSHDYGYYINQAGLVYKIIQGKQQAAAIATVVINQKIEVHKENNTLYLRFNNYRIPLFDIEIDSADAEKIYYGSIMIDKYNQEDIALTDIRHGGFADTGNQIELGYLGAGRDEFLPYRSGGKSYLVIDRSGTGDFSSPQTEYIPADEVDETRYKIIFNNIFWDKDGNGKDMFTFGYRQSNLIAVTTQKDPGCVDGVLQQNGQINVKIKQGFKAFSYLLINKDTKEEQEGIFFEDSLSIKNLAAGTYDLSLAEMGGFNLYPKQSGDYANKAVSSIYFNSVTNAYLEWTVSENTEAKAGMKTSATLINTASAAVVDYGLCVRDGQLYRVHKNTVMETSLGKVIPGDRLRVERVATKIYYKLNDVEVYSMDLPAEDRLAYNYAMAEVISGGIYNLKFNRMATTATWLTSDNLVLEKSSGDSMLQTITLSPDCDSQPVTTPVTEITDQNSRLTVHSETGTYTIKTSLQLDTAEAVTFIAYDLSGNPISKASLSAAEAKQEAELNVGRNGLYIIKAITANGEYTQKAIVQ